VREVREVQGSAGEKDILEELPCSCDDVLVERIEVEVKNCSLVESKK